MNPEILSQSYYEFRLAKLAILEAALRLRMQQRVTNGWHALNSDSDTMNHFAWAKYILQRELTNIVGIY